MGVKALYSLVTFFIDQMCHAKFHQIVPKSTEILLKNMEKKWERGWFFKIAIKLDLNKEQANSSAHKKQIDFFIYIDR